MDFIRIFILLCLFFYSFLVNAGSNVGIAFIHGTNDHRQDVEGSYWKSEFTSAIAQGLADNQNYRVINCDFRQNMWHEDAAGCVVDKLLSFIEEKHLDKLIIYTHSHGSNVMRWILSNPVYDPRYYQVIPAISQIIAISPSSGGTPLADEVMHGNVFESSVGWLLGYMNDSVRQQRVGDMAIYNDELLFGTYGRQYFSMPMRVVISSDVTASPFSSASYCNGYMLNLGLKFTKLYLDNCADGFLDCRSQALAGTVWFYDTEKTTNKMPLSHNQSRHSCFGFEQILIDDLKQQGA